MSEKGLFNQAYDYMLENREKAFNCIPFTSFPRLTKYLPGVMQGTYYLIGAYSGDGKTNTADSMFVYDVYDWYKLNKDKMDIKIDFIYMSYEIVKRTKALKAVSRRMFLKDGIVADVQFLSGFKKSRVTDEVINSFYEAMDYYEELEDLITIYDVPTNPTGTNKAMWQFAKDNGEILRKKVLTADGEMEVFDKYIPSHDNHYVIPIVDHIALSTLERGHTTKANIDKLSEYAVGWRNRFNFTPVFIQQFSADTLSIERQKAGKFEPDLNSFGDSKATVRDVNVALSLFNPYKFELNNHRGYDINKFRDHYRYLSVLKSRDGMANIGVGCYFHGGVNYIRELPPAGNQESIQKVYTMMDEVRSKSFGNE